MDDLYDIRHDRSEKSFRYPLYERWLFVVGIVVGVASLVVQERLGQFIQDSKPKGIAIVAGISLFVLLSFWISIRSWMSKILVTHKSIKAWFLWQGFSRISWQHMKEVDYGWRLLGHRLTFYGSDGARVSFRSSITSYDRLLEYIRANAPDHILEELDDIFGDDEDDEFDDEDEFEDEDEDDDESKEEDLDDDDELDDEDDDDDEDEDRD